jgi:hypothetical protein
LSVKTAEEMREYTRLKVARWRARNPERARAISRRQLESGGIARWRKAHPQDYRKKKLATYGLTIAAYDSMLAGQEGVCAICGRPSGKRRPAVDHDHATGKVRGLLCGRCNQGLGYFGDAPDRLRLAVAYLERNREGGE